jgi:hypothetical protein
MSEQSGSWRQSLVDDYPDAVVRIATLRADKQHHLLFAWVELFPFDMDAPDGWSAGEKPWPIPGTDGWTCGFVADRLPTAEALDWYEAAGRGQAALPKKKAKQVKMHAPPLGAEPAYGHFCVPVDAPFAFPWHDDPRVHRFVPLAPMVRHVREIAGNLKVRQWLMRNIGFDPFNFDEWLGGLALVAPNPLCSTVNVFPSAEGPDGSETLTIHVVPRRSAARGVADLASLHVHIAERRIDGWASLHTRAIGRDGYATIPCPQPCNEAAYALVCTKRGLLALSGPQSWIRQVRMDMGFGHGETLVEVPPGGRRKPGKTYSVTQRADDRQVVVGKSSIDAARDRLAHLRERRQAREGREKAPQKIFGVTIDKATSSNDEIEDRRIEAEEVIVDLVRAARRRLIFVDPFFGSREIRQFAIRCESENVTPKILTGASIINPDRRKWREQDVALIADLAYLAQNLGARAPQVRVMPGGDTPVIHDRLLIVDNAAWHCGPSFNEIGKRIGLMVRLPDSLSVRRVVAKVWCRSSPVSGPLKGLPDGAREP